MDAKFELGRVVITKGAAERLENDDEFYAFVEESLARYTQGDWGDTCDEDKKTNDAAIKDNDRILAVYKYENTTIWIITEWDRSVTTVLFPSEYQEVLMNNTTKIRILAYASEPDKDTDYNGDVIAFEGKRYFVSLAEERVEFLGIIKED